VRGLIEQYAEGLFDPATVSILEGAFEDAWRRVQTSKARPMAARKMPWLWQHDFLLGTSSPQQKPESAIPARWRTARSCTYRSRK